MKKLLNKKGMTLVEVIVVLVILAILAAVLVPSMISWIDEANKKTVIAEARSVLLAAQTIASEKYATTDTAEIDVTAVEKLAGVDAGTVSDITKDTDYKITGIIYTTAKYVATFNGSSWAITDKS